MPLNPCGRTCDFARRPYATSFRPFKDSDIEVGIRWRRVALDAPKLGTPSTFMSQDWIDNCYDEPAEQLVGEVWGVPRPYAPGVPLIGLDYLHVCGTPEEFADGLAFDAAANVQFDEQGLPLCCNGPAVTEFDAELGFEIELVPGVTCATALLCESGEVLYGLAGLGSTAWYRFEGSTVGAGSFEILAPTPNDPDLRFLIWSNSCAFLIAGPTFTGNTGTPAGVIFLGIPPTVFVQVIGNSNPPVPYAFKVTTT